ncbi:hypothetical protein RCH20_002402 [Psychrobacter sp. PL15]|uniref:Ltp family lipoprotein n=1 Tax=Psychrobacter sp. PL15 TaxID=3071719 RepID=UPI002DFFD0A4|nr:hypothetical protein [Psychrobacter sp. PL15]
MKKLLKWLAIIFVGLLIIGFIVGKDSAEVETAGVDAIEAPSKQPVVAESFEQSDPVVANVVDEVVAEEVEVQPEGLSRPQKNAVRSAKQYVSMTGFSRDGLIEQLSSEYGDGYEVNDSTVAVDSLGIDWNEQAVRSAEQYLNMTGFSCDGLIEQLSSSAGSKYTVSEATYGAQQAGACS